MKHNDSFIKIFLEDIIDKIISLEEFNEKQVIDNDAKMKKAIYYTHACVGILSCFGEMELSSRASALETLLRNNKLNEYFEGLNGWLLDVRTLMNDMQSHIDDIDKPTADFEYLKTQSAVLQNACREHDFEKAHELVGELNKPQWPEDIKSILLKVYTHILRGDLDNAADDLGLLPS